MRRTVRILATIALATAAAVLAPAPAAAQPPDAKADKRKDGEARNAHRD